MRNASVDLALLLVTSLLALVCYLTLVHPFYQLFKCVRSSTFNWHLHVKHSTHYIMYRPKSPVFFWLFCVLQQNCTVEMNWAGASAHPGMEKFVYDVEQFSIFWRRYK